MSSAPTPAAAFVAGRYVLRERLGSGAAGDVWSADDPRIGRRVAVKFLRPPDRSTGEPRTEWENRFLLEARAAGRLSHPGIVSIHDVGTASDGRPFIVMEFVEGQNLDALRRAEPHPTIEQIIRWTIEVADALDAAHRGGVVHRDIKPANILIGTDGRARITDFGIARVAESELTRDGVFLGSPAFASPEQLRGGKIDGRSDLFSLGAVVYLLCTRRRPFEGEDIGAIAYAACHAEPARPSSHNPEIPSALDAVILRALRKSPEGRFQTGRELAEALRGTAVGPRPSGFPAGTTPDRTLADTRVPAAPTAEERAVSIVRAARAAAEDARRLASSFAGWLRRTEPRVRQGAAAFAIRLREAWPGVRDRLSRLAGASSSHQGGRSRGWRTPVAIVAVAVAILAGRAWMGRDEAPRHGQLLERLRGIVAGKSSRVNVLVEHRLEDGIIEIAEDGDVLLRDSLEAQKKELFGVPFLSYRSGAESSTIRLTPGRHELTVDVKGRDGLELVRTLGVEVGPRSEYDLRISVATWPRKRISADWDVVDR